MTPEQLLQRINKLEDEVKELTDVINSLRSYTTIPFDIDGAFSERMGVGVSPKTASSENQLVNEAGSSAYNVLKSPDGFDKSVKEGINHYYPYYL